MSFNYYQFREYIIKPALCAIDLYSENAVLLLLGTAAQESGFGTYITQKQMDYEGGLGIYQMQSQTYYSVWDNKVKPYLKMKDIIRLYLGYDGRPAVQRLVSDLALATIMARLYYATVPEKLPGIYDLPGMAKYWKMYWNTSKGKGTEKEFITNYNKFVTAL